MKLFSAAKLEQIAPATEAIRFQANSRFPVELNALFQAIFDFNDEYTAKYNPSDSKGFYQKHLAIKNLIDNEIGPQIGKVIKKYTNLTVGTLSSNIPIKGSQSLTMFVAITEDTANFNDIVKLMEAASGQSTLTGKNLSDKMVELRKLSTTIDKSSGRILSKLDWNVVINIPVGFFVVQDIALSANDVKPFTSEEVTAALLHEIGHVFSWIEIIGDISYSGYYGNNVLRDIMVEFDSNPKATAKEIAKLGKNIDGLPKHINDIVKKSASYIESAANVLPETNEYESNAFQAVFRYICFILGNMLLFPTIYKILSGSLIGFIIHLLFQEFDTSISKYGDPSRSREYVTGKNGSLYERLADEYVSRYGMSPQLNSVLIKMYDFNDYLFKYSLETPIFNTTISNFFLTKLALFAVTLPFNTYIMIMRSLDDEDSANKLGYEGDITRIRRNVSNTIDVLKDSSLSPEIKNKLIKDIEDMEKKIDQYDRGFVAIIAKVCKFMASVPKTIISIPRYVFGSAGADQDFIRLFNHLDNMLSNKSFYYAAKFNKFSK